MNRSEEYAFFGGFQPYRSQRDSISRRGPQNCCIPNAVRYQQITLQFPSATSIVNLFKTKVRRIKLLKQELVGGTGKVH